jgi:methylenetetrahydrofolate--tRNA-(uracil-5-)-methyltransferase
MAERGLDTLRFGPMRPVGLRPDGGESPWAVVQLRSEDRARTAYNLVGFQTRLAYPEQKRILRMIPALREAEFLRLGSIHRNTYVDAPRRLGPELELRGQPDVRLAGLLVGVEGYVECAAMGLLAAVFLAGRLRGRPVAAPPPTTALGALHQHVTRMRGEGEAFGPANAHFGLLPPVPGRFSREERRLRQVERARADLGPWLVQAA